MPTEDRSASAAVENRCASFLPYLLVDQRAILGEVQLVLVNLASPERHLLEAK